MCIIALKKPGVEITDETIKTCFEANPHGAGFAYFTPSRGLGWVKGLFTVQDLIKAYRNDTTADMTTLLHFRIATIGGKTTANCHPFEIEHGVMAHNGPCVNRSFCSGTAELSDSAQFAEQFVKHHTWEEIERNKKFIEAFVGTEKVVFLFNDGRTQIINEKCGEWKDGIWYSNSSYLPRAYTAPKHWLNNDFDYGDWGYGSHGGGFNNRKGSPVKTSVWSPHFKTLLPKYVRVKKDAILPHGLYIWTEEAHAYIHRNAKPSGAKVEAIEGILIDGNDIVGAHFTENDDIDDFLVEHGEDVGAFSTKKNPVKLLPGKAAAT